MKRAEISGIVVSIGGALVTGLAPTIAPAWVAQAGVLLGVFLIAIGLALLLSQKRVWPFGHWIPMWSITVRISDWTPLRSMVPVNVAVQQAVDALDDRTAGIAARQLGVSPTSYMWHAIMDNNIDLWGTEPPAQKLKKLPSSLSAQGLFVEDQNAFRLHGARANSYENLHVLRRDLRASVAALKRWDIQHPKG